MRIHTITVKGFGPYRDETHVDIDAFAVDGLFLIGGKTGAGKSSLLDALAYGLFGTVPRYGGKADEQVRSRYLEPGEPTEVAVEFSVGSTRYRVWRSPAYQRPKQRGDGFTTQAAQLTLSRRAGDDYEVFETKIGNAERHVQGLIGLTAHQFLQVVLLAQGQFQEFLVAGSEERRALLRTLFRTERFDRYTEAVRERARAAEAEVGAQTAAIDQATATLARHAEVDPPASSEQVDVWIEDLLATRRVIVEETSRRAEAAERAHADAEQQSREVERVISLQRRRADALERRTLLDQRREDIEEQRRAVASAQQAAVAHPAVRAARTATTALEEAERSHRRAAEAAPGLPRDDVESLRLQVVSLTEQIGALTAPAATEHQLPDLEQRSRDARDADQAFSQTVERQRVERRQTDTALSHLAERIAADGDLGARHAEQQAEVERLTARSHAARRAATFREEVAEAERHRLARQEAAHDAEKRLIDLRRRQLDGWASTVAAELSDGEPCPVCGSVEHPSPARPGEDHVDGSAVDQAEIEHQQARDRESEASESLTRLTTALEAAEEEAGASLEELTTLAAEARTEWERRKADLAAHEERQAEAARIRRRLADLDTALLASDRHQAELSEQATAAQITWEKAAAEVAEARGDHPSVADRLRDLRQTSEAAQRLLTAAETLTRRRAEADEAEQALAAALAESPFASAEQVEAALLPAVEVNRLDREVAEHDQARASVESVLAEPELADLPAEPIDSTASRDTYLRTRTAARQSAAEQATAQERLDSLTGQARTLRSLISRSADQLARCETVRDLDEALHGAGANELKMPLETFALAAELDDILGAANGHLARMTTGRYTLHRSADVARRGRGGLDLLVLDAHTDDARTPASLSGGEKFQASLALALGLAEAVTARAGGLRLDTLFIDEGFGSLDPETLEVTMETLDALREGGRVIGLISHVEAMKEQIPAQLRVEVADGGWSRIGTIV
ncbi:MAG: SMC family ATPase [Aeromicrobium sp.]|uniref:AAA family ATPase n=1 Tax=Aeromicrobium sp. TaxID=1871063 RepID=UPI0039E3DC06